MLKSVAYQNNTLFELSTVNPRYMNAIDILILKSFFRGI